MPRPLTFIAYYTPHNKHSLNAVTAALETHIQAPLFSLETAGSLDALIARSEDLAATGHRVLTGWSFHTADSAARFREISEFRRRLPSRDIINIAGGVHATARSEETLRGGFDYVALGEGEQTAVDIVTTLLNDQALSETRGLAFFDEQRLVVNPLREPIVLDGFPSFPSGLDKAGPVEITRGCIYGCYYCQTSYMYGIKFRHRSVESITDHVEKILRINGHYIRFITPSALSYGSDDHSVNPEALEHLLKSVREAIGPDRKLYYGTFPSEVRPEHVTPDIIRILKKCADNDNIIIGAQSGSDDILRLCNRGHTVDNVIRAVETARNAGFKVHVDFIFGLPGETYKDAQSTVDLINILIKMDAKIHGHIFTPLPGTPYQNKPAGKLWPDIRIQLDRMASRSLLYGKWF